MQIRGVVSSLAVACLALGPLAFGCDDGGGDAEPPRFDAAVVDGGSDGGGGAGGGSGETEDRLRLSYTRRIQARDGSPAVVDMMVYDFEDNEEYNLTGGEGVVDCVTKICRLNADMTWIGWLEPDPASGGFQLRVAPVDVVRKVVLTDQVRQVDNGVNDFRFTTYQGVPEEGEEPRVVELIVYSKGQAQDIDDDIDVRASPVAEPDAEACADGAGLPDCPSFVGAINTNGGFRVTQFGSLLILIETTLSTMTVKFNNVATGAQSTIFVFGQAMMTGSQFDGRQPIGFAPDASYLAVFTRDELVWRLNVLDARPNAPEPEVHPLFELESNPDGDCFRQMPYNFNEVRFDPVFSSDSEWIYFLARGDCSRSQANETPTNRDDFDILRINRDLGGPVENVTDNLRANHWSNHEIGDFDLSPDGTKLVFTAPRPNQATDRAIWLIDPETGAYDCSRGESLPVLDGRERCEFIASDLNDAEVVLRDLNFHTVQVPVD